MAFLKIIGGESKGERFEIDRDTIVIGRAPDNVIVIDDSSVSGKHCEVIRQGRRFTLRDLDSTNGTQLNGVNIAEHQLSPGDVIHVGSVEVLFDGENIEAYTPAPAPMEDTEVFTHPPSAGATPSQAFNTRKNRRWTGIAVIVISSLLLLTAMALFLYRLFVG